MPPATAARQSTARRAGEGAPRAAAARQLVALVLGGTAVEVTQRWRVEAYDQLRKKLIEVGPRPAHLAPTVSQPTPETGPTSLRRPRPPLTRHLPSDSPDLPERPPRAAPPPPALTVSPCRPHRPPRAAPTAAARVASRGQRARPRAAAARRRPHALLDRRRRARRAAEADGRVCAAHRHRRRRGHGGVRGGGGGGRGESRARGGGGEGGGGAGD